MVGLVVAFGAGLVIGVVAGGDKDVRPSVYEGKEPAVAAQSLLDIALDQAGKGSWERIAVARVHYLAGRKDEGQAIFDEYLGGKGEPSDALRIARVYVEAGEWDKAKTAYLEVVERAPKKGAWAVEAGAQFNLAGDREQAETLFGQGFAREPEDLWSTLKAAASYEGVPPQTW